MGRAETMSVCTAINPLWLFYVVRKCRNVIHQSRYTHYTLYTLYTLHTLYPHYTHTIHTCAFIHIIIYTVLYVYSVEPLLEGPLRKGQPLYKGHFSYLQQCTCILYGVTIRFIFQEEDNLLQRLAPNCPIPRVPTVYSNVVL